MKKADMLISVDYCFVKSLFESNSLSYQEKLDRLSGHSFSPEEILKKWMDRFVYDYNLKADLEKLYEEFV